MQDKITPSCSSSVSISAEALSAESYADLIRTRRPGAKFGGVAGKERAISVSYKDLLVLTRFHGKPFGPLAAAVDARLNGAIERAIEKRPFGAMLGETLVVNVESRGLGSGNPRNILVVGLGDQAAYGQFVYCGLIGSVINEATNLDAEHVLFPLADLNLAGNPLPVEKFAAILSCRVSHHLSTLVEHGRLRKIRLIVEPDMKERIDAGLAGREPLCKICSEPAF